MLILLMFLQLSDTVAIVDPTQVMVNAVAGFVASFGLSILKRKFNDPSNQLPTIKRAAAHTVMLVISLAIVLGVLWFRGRLTGWVDVVSNLSMVAVTMASTYQYLISKFGLVEDKGQ